MSKTAAVCRRGNVHGTSSRCSPLGFARKSRSAASPVCVNDWPHTKKEVWRPSGSGKTAAMTAVADTGQADDVVEIAAYQPPGSGMLADVWQLRRQAREQHARVEATTARLKEIQDAVNRHQQDLAGESAHRHSDATANAAGSSRLLLALPSTDAFKYGQIPNTSRALLEWTRQACARGRYSGRTCEAGSGSRYGLRAAKLVGEP